MAYQPRDRQEEDALTLYRLQSDADAFLLRVADATGPGCRLLPGLRLSVSAIREAIDDLTGDINGEPARLDPDRRLQATADRERVQAMRAPGH